MQQRDLKQEHNRVHKKHEEKLDHITLTHSVLAKEEYIKRQERGRAQLPLNIRVSKETGVKEKEELWYEHVPKSGETSRDAAVTILWIQQVTTDKTIPNSKTDIITIIMKNDMSVTVNCNFRKRNFAQERRCKYLKMFISDNKHRVYVKCKIKVIPVIKGVKRIISKSSRKYIRIYLGSRTSRNY